MSDHNTSYTSVGEYIGRFASPYLQARTPAKHCHFLAFVQQYPTAAVYVSSYTYTLPVTTVWTVARFMLFSRRSGLVFVQAQVIIRFLQKRYLPHPGRALTVSGSADIAPEARVGSDCSRSWDGLSFAHRCAYSALVVVGIQYSDCSRVFSEDQTMRSISFPYSSLYAGE